MKRTRFTEEQIIGVLKEHEAGVKTADLCRKHGVSQATFFKWKSKFGSGRREPSAEEAAGRDDARCHDVEGPQFKKMVTPAVKRQVVAHLCASYEVSQRRAVGSSQVGGQH